jgi:hypothetical protein
MSWAWRAPTLVAGRFAIFSPNNMPEIVHEAALRPRKVSPS